MTYRHKIRNKLFLKFDESTWYNMQKWGISVSAAAEASFDKFTLGRNVTTKYEQEES
jgi:hypothetical protein